jgi:hypothetical protein
LGHLAGAIARASLLACPKEWKERRCVPLKGGFFAKKGRFERKLAQTQPLVANK